MALQLQINREKLNEIRLSHARWAGGIGLGSVFIPLADMLVMGTIWTSLLVQLAEATGHPVDSRYAKKFGASMIKGLLVYLAGSRLGTWLLSMTGFGAPGAMVLNAGLNFGYTWLLGGFLIEQFSQPDVDLKGLAKSAAAYLLSFGVAEIAHIQDLHDAATTAVDAHHAATTVVDIHHAANAATDIHHVANTATDVHHAATSVVDAHHAFSTTYSLPHHAADAVRFTGLDHTELIAGTQGQHPWCGVHSLGNLVQMSYPGQGEHINDLILNVAGQHGGLVASDSGLSLDINHYLPMLTEAFHVPAHWETFDPTRVAEFLHQNHGILVVGDAHFLNPIMYPQPNAWHAFNLTDISIDNNGMTWFKGLDSNVASNEVWWSADAVQKALDRGCEAYNGRNMLVTDNPVAWPWKHA